MEKLFLSFLCSITTTFCFSQKILDKSYLKCQYQYVYLKDTIDRKTSDDLLILQIGKNISKCYSYYSNQVDSLYSLPNWNIIVGEMYAKAIKNGDIKKKIVPHKRMKTYVYKNYPKQKMTVTDGISMQDFIYEDELNAQSWHIQDSTKIIMDYQCQMAESDFRGRHWTVWFAPDIPVSDGPWKLGGLPGLIMEASDKGEQYRFTIIGLEKKEESIVFNKSSVESEKHEKTNRKNFLKTEINYLMDTSGYNKMETGIDLSGNKPPKVIRYDLIEKDYK